MARKRTIETNNRIEQAVKLRAQGYTYEQIARSCGYSGRQSAQKAVQNELSRRVSANVDEMRKLQQLALDEIIRLLWSRLTTKKGTLNLFVVDRILKALDQEAKLWGLYAPRARSGETPYSGKTHVVIIREVKTDYQKWLKDQQERKGP